MTAVLRGEEVKTSNFQKFKKLFTIMADLQKILSDHNVAIILVNQVLNSSCLF